MSDFDIAIGADGATLNQTSTVVYKQLYPKLFKGQKTVDHGGKITIAWDVEAAPTFVLQPPKNGECLLASHFEEHSGWSPPAGITLDQIKEAIVANAQGNVFQMLMSQVAISINKSPHDIVPITVIVQLVSGGGKVSFNPLKATAKSTHRVDEWILNHVILPEALAIARGMLSGIKIPAPSFDGIRLTPLTLGVTQDHLIAVANLAGKKQPAVPTMAWPSTPFFALLSADARLAVAHAGTAGFHKNFSHSGSAGTHIGTVSYSVSATVDDLSVSLAGSPSDFTFSADLSGSAEAHIKVGCTHFGVGYNVEARPDPSGLISLSVDGGSEVQATVTGVNNFVLILKPTGSPVEWILSAITEPVLEAIAAALSPEISSELKGISFPVWKIPSISFSVEGIHITISPSDVNLGSFASMLSVEGHLAIS